MNRELDPPRIDFDPTGPVDLATALVDAAIRTPGKTLLVDRTGTDARVWTYEAFACEAARVALGLEANGVGSGDRVAVALSNCDSALVAWAASASRGAVHVSMDPEFAEANLVNALRRTTPRLVIGALPGEDLLRRALDIAECDARLIVLDDTASDGGIGQLRVLCADVGAVDLERAASVVASNVGQPTDLAGVMFTSGSTGSAKAVQMSNIHQRIFAETCRAQVGLTADDVYLISNPVCHANALMLGAYPSILSNAEVALYRRFSAGQWLDRVRESGATVTNLIGPMMDWLCQQPRTADDRRHRLRRVRSVPATPGLEDEFASRFGVPDVLQGFGQTEIGLPFLSHLGERRPPGAVGRLNEEFYEVAFADPNTGDPHPAATDGEILVRPKVPGTMTAGYLGEPELNSQLWANGWFHTGDILERDEHGWYYYRGRTKDVIRRRGKNVSALDVEAAIERHPDVIEAGVVGVPDRNVRDEEMVRAVVVGRVGLSEEALSAFLEPLLPKYALPSEYLFVTELPRTTNGKLSKGTLRQMSTRKRIEPITEDEWDDTTRPILEAVRQHQGRALNIFPTLARHPKLLKRWMGFANHVLLFSTLPPREREIVILRTGYRSKSAYEWAQHVSIALEAGVSMAEIDYLAGGPAPESWSAFDDLLVTATDELVDHYRISDSTWAALAAQWSPQQLMDMVFAVGQYVMVSMALNSFGVEIEPDTPKVPEALFESGYFETGAEGDVR